jgi:hypothetical protein
MHYVDEYFSRSVTLFKDDMSFMNELTKLLLDAIPLNLRHEFV